MIGRRQLVNPSPFAGNRRPRPLALAALAALLALAGATAGCGLFDPATPDPPFTGGGLPLPQLTEPDSALYSLELGIQNKRSELYYHALAETSSVTPADFHATFDPQDAAEFQALTHTPPPADWTSSDEKSFFTFFVRQPAAYVTYFLPDPSRQDVRGPQETIFYRRYRIYAGPLLMAAGLADLTFRTVGLNSEWKLTYWVDRRDTTAATYGRQRLDSLAH
jgi:hypothetical protein